MSIRALGPLLLVAVALSASVARAQGVDEAAERFRRGITLLDERSFEAALIEFQAAYDASPAWQVLYNVGSCHQYLGHPVEAVDAWERYLEEGGAEVPAERRAEVEAALAEQRSRIGTVLVRTNVEGAQITVDGVVVATAPLAEPLRLAIGTYQVGVQAAGWQGQVRRVTVAGESQRTLDVLLERAVLEQGQLRVESAVLDAEVRIDDELVGTTPLDGTVPVTPGRHRVELRRGGYTSYRRQVDVEAGQTLDVAAALTIDPDADVPRGVLRLRLPDAPAVVEVDGAPLPTARGEHPLPTGRHRVEIRVEERVPVRETVTVEADGRAELTPALRWTDDAHARRIRDAEQVRVAGGIVLAAGLASAIGGAVFVGLAEVFLADRRDANYDTWFSCTMTGMFCGIDLERDAQMYVDDGVQQDAFRWTYGILFGVAAAAIPIGAILIAIAPSEESIDAGASARLRVGPGSVALHGRF